MGFFSRHRKAFKSVIASFGMLFGLLAGVSVTTNVAYAGTSGSLDSPLNEYLGLSVKNGTAASSDWLYSGRSISGSISGGNWLGRDCTLSIKNNKQLAEFSFDWNVTIEGGSATIDGTKYSSTQNGNVTRAEFQKGQTVEVVLEPSKKSTVSVQITNIQMVLVSTPAIKFVPSQNGYFKVDDITVDSNFTQPDPRDSRIGFKLQAFPNSGYDFVGWQVKTATLTKIAFFENPTQFKYSEDCEATAVFKKGQGFAIFGNDSRYFGDLNEAISHAKSKNNSDKTIVAVKDGTVASGNYTLDSGLSLLIPNEDGAALSQYATTDPKFIKNTASACTLFRKISFLEGVNLNVYGQVVVCCTPAFKTVSSNVFNCHTAIPSGAYGQIDMQQGSTMTLQSGAELFAWGFVTGDGLVEGKSGSTVYELFQMSSWRGGGVASDMTDNSQKVFVINQYYVQNVECELKLWAGSTEKTLTGMYMSKEIAGVLAEDTPHPCFVFIGSGGMFNLSSGYLVKKYDPASDRLLINVCGNGLLSSIAFSLTVLKVIPINLDSKNYVLPINNNISITIKSGFACSTNQDLGFLPGSELIIEKGASFEVQSSHNLTFYDLDNWGNYATEAKLRPVLYSPTRTKTRTEADLTDAKLALDGTLTIGSGSYLMTTGQQITGNAETDRKTNAENIGARIISPGRTGVIKFTDANATSYPAVYQYDGHSADKYVAIDHSCAKLQNGDHSYTQSAPGNTYHYDKVLDRWSLSTDHATKSGLFKTIDNNGVIKTVLLENDVMSTGRSGLFHYSSTTYKAGDNHYYYLQSGVVVNNKKWYQENGKWYFFGTNQYAYQDMSAVFTASTGIVGFGIQARYFFNDAATVERLTTVNNVTGLSGDITIGADSYCYYKSIKAGIGLFEKQSGSNYSVYLAKDDGTLMTNGTYYVPSHKINNIKDSSGKVLTAGLYCFDKNGHMYDSNFKEITRGNAS